MVRYLQHIRIELFIELRIPSGTLIGVKNNTMVNYDAYATTFSNSRKNLQWPELDAIIEDMRQSGYTSVLDVGCGNGRLLTEIQNSKFKIQNYLGIDSSECMIEEARGYHPESLFRTCSMLTS
jgi:ubiquinone/menaquinone biosynthesis C-methylase UbiE